MTVKEETFNTKKAVAFLKAFRQSGLINIVAIDPHSEYVTGITRPVNSADLSEFIEKNNGKQNLYFMVNEPKEGSPDGKLKKENVDKIHAVWLDADPAKDKPFEDERVRITNFAEELKGKEEPPTYIVDSGGGFQAFWVLDKPMQVTDEMRLDAEALSRGLAVTYDTDRVQNIDRIMRVPFTLNIPGVKKKKRGRKEAPASVYYAKSAKGERYEWDDLGFIEPAFGAEAEENFTDTELDMEKARQPIHADLKEKLQNIRKHNNKVDAALKGELNKHKPSNSEVDLALTKELKLEGYSLEEVANILCNFPHGSVIHKKGAKQRREIIRTYNRTIVQFFDELPQDYVDAIAKQTNPITKMREDKKKKMQGRRGLVHISDATHETSGIPLIKELFDQQSVVLLFGPPNSGKSFVTLDIGVAVATGQAKWDQFKIKEKMGVLVVCGEAGQSYGKRVEAVRQRYNVPKDASYSEVPFAHLDNYYNFMDEKEHLNELRQHVLELERLSGHKTGLVIIDTLSATFGSGNENAAEDARKYLGNLRQIANELEFSLLIVHHTGKDVNSGARGSSVFLGDVDTQLAVNAVKRGNKYERTLLSTKQRESGKDKKTKFGLRVIELAKDEDGDPITTCTVSLQDDNDFDDLTPQMAEGMDKGEKAVYRAVQLYLEHEINPDMYRFTQLQLLQLLHRDIKDSVGVLVSNDGVLNMSDVDAMAKPNGTIQKAFKRDADKLLDSSHEIETEVIQLLMGLQDSNRQ